MRLGAELRARAPEECEVVAAVGVGGPLRLGVERVDSIGCCGGCLGSRTTEEAADVAAADFSAMADM